MSGFTEKDSEVPTIDVRTSLGEGLTRSEGVRDDNITRKTLSVKGQKL